MDAVINCVTEDGSLYLPERFPVIPGAFFNNIAQMTLPEIGYVVANMLFGTDLPSEVIKNVVDRALTYPIPFIRLSDNEFMLDLTRGPSRSYNDVGARFFAEMFKVHTNRPDCKVMVAASTGTLTAVANAFRNINGVTTFAVYPAGELSKDRREHLRDMGDNVVPVEVNGSLGECREMVKQLFIDRELRNRLHLISANSANLAILLPRVIFFFYAYAQLRKLGLPLDKVVIAIPTRNFGNLTSALIANRMGLPVSRFMAINHGEDNERHINDSRLAVLHEKGSATEIYSPANHPLADDEICIRLLTEQPLDPTPHRKNQRHGWRIAPSPQALKRIITSEPQPLARPAKSQSI